MMCSKIMNTNNRGHFCISLKENYAKDIMGKCESISEYLDIFGVGCDERACIYIYISTIQYFSINLLNVLYPQEPHFFQNI